MNRKEMEQKIVEIKKELNDGNAADATDLVTDLLDDAIDIASDLTTEEKDVIAKLAGNVTGCIVIFMKSLDPYINITNEEMLMISSMAYQIAVLAYKMGLEEGELNGNQSEGL